VPAHNAHGEAVSVTPITGDLCDSRVLAIDAL
jgi:hypothetical protein